MKLLQAMFITILVVLTAGCMSDKFKTAEDGFQYKFVKKGDGTKAKNGDFCIYNVKYVDEKDTVIFETTPQRQIVLSYEDSSWENTMGPLYKGLAMMGKNDSLILKIPTKRVYEESFKMRIPMNVNPEGELTFYIGAENILDSAGFMAFRQEKQKEKVAKDVAVIEEYLAENNISAQSTESGLRYVIEVEGTGDSPQPGDSVKVHYTGMLLDGTKFDSSVDRGEPIEFPLGVGYVIPGWDEGIALLKKGGKGTLYIPSQLAYGEGGRPPVIKPNSILKFDVELIDIK